MYPADLWSLLSMKRRLWLVLKEKGIENQFSRLQCPNYKQNKLNAICGSKFPILASLTKTVKQTQRNKRHTKTALHSCKTRQEKLGFLKLIGKLLLPRLCNAYSMTASESRGPKTCGRGRRPYI